jgi:hypothetical protein
MTTPAPETGGQAEGTGTAPEPEGQEQQPQGEQQQPEGGQDLEYWKRRARENEQKAKANAAAAKKLQEQEDAQKSDSQKVADAAAQAQRERDEARAETLRYKAAATHHVTEANFDLLGTGSEEDIMARAKRVGVLEADSAELKALKAQQAPPAPEGDGTGPVKKLTPGQEQPPDNSYPAGWFPNLKKANQPTST